MPQFRNEQNNYFLQCFPSLTHWWMFDLSRFCFLGFILHTQREIFGSLRIHFSSTFTQNQQISAVCYGDGRQWIKAIIDFTPTTADFGFPNQSWPIYKIFHAQFGQAHLDFDFLQALALMCYAYDLAQLNFHAFLAVFFFTLTPISTDRHRPHWKLALQQLLLIFVRSFVWWTLFSSHQNRLCTTLTVSSITETISTASVGPSSPNTRHCDLTWSSTADPTRIW